MVIFKSVCTSFCPEIKLVYIPIWLYSNLFIQYFWEFPRISLHSNMVIFKWIIFCRIIMYNRGLHSNMVIFKFEWGMEVPEAVSKFTFQYGYIQITGVKFNWIKLETFTFQYGYIQINAFQSV